jgi:hypothetical protein
MTTISVSIPNDARDYLEHRARVHGVTLPVLIKKAIAVTRRQRSITSGATAA